MIIWVGCFVLKLSFSHVPSGFINWIFLLLQTPNKLRNSQIYKSDQPWYTLNYSNFYQVFVHIFEIYIVRKISGSIYSYGVGKNSLLHALFFLNWRFCSNNSINSIRRFVVVPSLFMYILGRGSWSPDTNTNPCELWCIITVFQIFCKASKL